MTDAERRLWLRLRDRRLQGHKFRRQHPLGPYVLDFFCEASKLVVEIDGSQHANNEAKDATRTQWLEAHGCHVLRFWNNDVLTNIDGILTTILAAAEAPHPGASRRPSPPGRGFDWRSHK